EVHARAPVLAVAVDADDAAHELDQALRDRESESRAAELARRGAVTLDELLEHHLLAVGGDSGAGVRDLDPHVAELRVRARAHLDRSLRRELEAVADEIDEHLLDLAE